MLRLELSSRKAPTAPSELFPAFLDYAGRPCAFGWRTGEWSVLLFPDVGTFAFSPGRSEVIAYVDDDVDRAALIDIYMTNVLPVAGQVVHGIQSLHGSATLYRGAVVCFCGESWSGKTTLAYGLARRGHELWGDDVTTVDVSHPGSISSVRVPFELGLRDGSIEYFGKDAGAEMRGTTTSDWARVPLRAFFVLTPDESVAGHELERLNGYEAFTALMKHSYNFLPQSRDGKRSTVSEYLEVAALVPTYRLRYLRGFGVLAPMLDAVESVLDT
jgi:hypothetical protein